MLKRLDYNNIRCYAYSIPAIVNRAASHLFDGFLLSIVIGDDVVPRMNLHSLELLRADVNRLLENCDLPKYQIFASAIQSYIKGNKSKKAKLLDETQGGTVSQNDKTKASDELEKITNTALSIPKKMRVGNQAHFIHTIKGSCPPMFIPGRILYLEKVRNTGDIISIKVKTRHSINRKIHFCSQGKNHINATQTHRFQVQLFAKMGRQGRISRDYCVEEYDSRSYCSFWDYERMGSLRP